VKFIVRNHTNEQPPFVCPFCSKTFKEQGGVNLHVRVLHLHEKFQCKICDKELSGKTALKYHTMVHKHEFSCNCETCGKQFRSKHNLMLHQRIHNTKKLEPLVCKLCCKKFANKAGMSKHLKSCIIKVDHTDL